MDLGARSAFSLLRFLLGITTIIGIVGCDPPTDSLTDTRANDSSAKSPGPCALGQTPQVATLCGSADAPCTVQAFETVVEMASLSGWNPSLALDAECNPLMTFGSYATNDDPERGFVATRQSSNAWFIESLWSSSEYAGLAMHPDGYPLLFARKSDGRLVVMAKTPFYGWMTDFEFLQEQWLITSTVVQAATGAIFFARGFLDYRVQLSAYSPKDRDFTSAIVSHVSESQVAIAASPGGRLHALLWKYDGTSTLHYYAGINGESTPIQGASWLLGIQQLGIGESDTGNPEGKPHILALQTPPPPAGAPSSLVYATRNAPDSWDTVTIETADSAYALAPIAVFVEPNGELKMLHRKDCELWLDVVSPGPTIASTKIPLDGCLRMATAVRDGLGRIHLAFRDANVPSSMKYALLGP